MSIQEYDTDKDLEEVLGHETAEQVRGMRHGDGVLTQSRQSYQSVVQKIATAIIPDKEYRQALLLASFLSPEEADKASLAISECQRYGVKITPLIDKIIARCGVKGFTGGRVQDIKETLTHQYISNLNQRQQSGKYYSNRQTGPLKE